MATQVIGGDMLTPFYSSAVLVPFNYNQTFVPLGSISGSNWQIPFCRANPRRKRGLPDTTHSWYPATRGRRQTQVTWECLINVFLDPSNTPEAYVTTSLNTSGFQMYLTLSQLGAYPSDVASQLYFWVPSVFVEEVPHNIDVKRDPAEPIDYDLIVRSNSPAFFLPTDNEGSPSSIGTFTTYITAKNWAF